MTGVFANKTALITGAASGIGRATALGFAAEGAQVVLLDVDEAGLRETLAAAGGDSRGRIVTADLADPAAIRIVACDLLEAVGDIHFLANVAGWRPRPDAVLGMEERHWATTMAINVTSPAVLIDVLGQNMIDHELSGRIVNVSSSSAFRSSAPASYACAKAGMLALTRTAASELGKFDINVNSVVPGLTRTPMAIRSHGADRIMELAKDGPFANLLGRVSEPEDVAAVTLFLCRPESRQITGQAIHTSAGQVL